MQANSAQTIKRTVRCIQDKHHSRSQLRWRYGINTLRILRQFRKSKLKFYWSVIRPIVVYGCETWVLKESIIQRLSVSERHILRKICGPTKENNGIWRTKTNKELDELIKHQNLINYIKSQRLSWFGHINRMPESCIVKKIYKWKPFTGRPVGRPKTMSEMT
jgi:hypothetical protein